jgi:HEAT repeats
MSGRQAARALSRLGQACLVLAMAAELPEDVVVAAVIAPYTSFRDRAASPLPLDYQPLAGVLEHQPRYAAAIAAELGPGRGEAAIGPGETGEALYGLASPHAIIRSHAARVLGDRYLGPAAAPRILPRLAAAARDDPDPDVRRLAILPLHWWGNDARPYAHVIRDASDNDRHPGVRDTAARCLLETAARQAGTL